MQEFEHKRLCEILFPFQYNLHYLEISKPNNGFEIKKHSNGILCKNKVP